jgi:hypothetical protein
MTPKNVGETIGKPGKPWENGDFTNKTTGKA